MKLYITEELNFKVKDPEEVNGYSDFLKQFTIFHEVKNGSIFIETQKVNLNEKDMNELFDDVFYMFEIEYAGMGGAGCEFSLNVKMIGD